MNKIKRSPALKHSLGAHVDWQPLIAEDSESAAQLFHNQAALIEKVKGTLSWLVALVGSWKAAKLLRAYKKHFRERELEQWAQATNCTVDDVLAANLAYEFSQFASYAGSRLPTLCTSVACRWHDRIYHFRTLDWLLEGIGPASRELVFTSVNFTAISWPGFLGVVSGVAPGRFSITLNQAAPTRPLNLDGMPPALLIREAFESCATYSEAVQLLSTRNIATDCFIMICSFAHASVIEHTAASRILVTEIHGDVLASANHRPEDESQKNGWAEPIYDSMLRKQAAEKAGRAAAKGKKQPTVSSFLHKTICNESTAQMMLLDPAKGNVSAYWRDTDAACRRLLA